MKLPCGTIIIGALALAGIGLALASFAPPRPALVWNFTASAPLGLYRVLDRPWVRGDWVVVRPSSELGRVLSQFDVLERGRFLVKQVAAAEGDQVCRSGADISINGDVVVRAQSVTSSGRALPAWDGCRMLAADEVFLLGRAEGSFDGRYFGATPTHGIVAPVAPIPLPWTH